MTTKCQNGTLFENTHFRVSFGFFKISWGAFDDSHTRSAPKISRSTAWTEKTLEKLEKDDFPEKSTFWQFTNVQVVLRRFPFFSCFMKIVGIMDALQSSRRPDNQSESSKITQNNSKICVFEKEYHFDILLSYIFQPIISKSVARSVVSMQRYR